MDYHFNNKGVPIEVLSQKLSYIQTDFMYETKGYILDLFFYLKLPTFVVIPDVA